VCDDAEFLDRVQGNGLPRLASCPATAARGKVVLVARAVDEDIHVIGRKRARGKRLPSVVGSAVLDAGSGRELDKSKKVPIGERQTLDLLPVTLVATSDVRVSTPDAATTVTASTWIAEAASFKSNGYTSPINTRTWIFWAPSRSAVRLRRIRPA